MGSLVVLKSASKDLIDATLKTFGWSIDKILINVINEIRYKNHYTWWPFLLVVLTPFPYRGSAIASPSENLIETRFALDRERPRRTGRDAGSTGRHRPGTSSSRLPAADEVPKGPQ